VYGFAPSSPPSLLAASTGALTRQPLRTARRHGIGRRSPGGTSAAAGAPCHFRRWSQIACETSGFFQNFGDNLKIYPARPSPVPEDRRRSRATAVAPRKRHKSCYEAQHGVFGRPNEQRVTPIFVRTCYGYWIVPRSGAHHRPFASPTSAATSCAAINGPSATSCMSRIWAGFRSEHMHARAFWAVKLAGWITIH
jgi:hypothetical protein